MQCALAIATTFPSLLTRMHVTCLLSLAPQAVHPTISMEGQQEAILQAVVLADPFEHQSRYGPLVRGGNKDGEGCESANPWVSGAAGYWEV